MFHRDETREQPIRAEAAVICPNVSICSAIHPRIRRGWKHRDSGRVAPGSGNAVFAGFAAFLPRSPSTTIVAPLTLDRRICETGLKATDPR
jgi:hypothetical protein